MPDTFTRILGVARTFLQELCIPLWLLDRVPTVARVLPTYFLNAGDTGFQGLVAQSAHRLR